MPHETQPGDREKPGNAPAGAGVGGDAFESRLRALDKSLERRQQTEAAQAARRSDTTGMAMALRLATDFVAAVLVGAGLGWGIDWLLGSTPWAMIVLLLLGFCAGVLNVLRAAGRIADPHAGKAPAGRPEMYDDEDEK